MNQVSIILASIDMNNSKFSLRVLKERRLEDLLFGDKYAAQLVLGTENRNTTLTLTLTLTLNLTLGAAKRTTKRRPLLQFKA